MTVELSKREEYIAFLRSKIPQAEVAGFEPLSAPHTSLFPHQCDIATWACRGGRRAVFANFGLGKTRIHLQIAKWIVEFTGGKYLIIAPLGVRQEFTQSDGPATGMDIQYVRNDAEVSAATSSFLITNYERVRDGQIDLSQFAGAGLDEASVLRSFGSLTYQQFLRMFRVVKYRFVFTATPSPNRYKELIHYGGFLGIMDTGDALTRFFKRDSSEANNLTLMPSMESQFWLWLNSWAVFIQRPSDLGYSDEGYDMPPIHVHWHCLDVDHRKAWQQVDSWGQAQLLREDAQGLKAGASIKRESIALRVSKALEIIDTAEDLEAQSTNREPEAQCEKCRGHHVALGSCTICGHEQGGREPRHWLIWHDLEAERDELERRLPKKECGKGWRTVYGNQDLEEREESIMAFSRGEYRILATKPVIAGSGCNFQRHCSDAIFLGVGYKFNDFIQACHRIARFMQKHEVHIHIIYLDSESSIAETLKAKWRRHTELMSRMTALLQEHRLTNTTTMELIRALGCERAEVKGERFRAIRNDVIIELMPSMNNPQSEHDESSSAMARGPQKGEAGIRRKADGTQPGKEEGAKSRMVSEEQGEVRNEGCKVEQGESIKEAIVSPEVLRQQQGQDRGEDAGVVSQQSIYSPGEGEESGTQGALRDDSRGIFGDVGSTGLEVSDLRNGPKANSSEGANRSLSQDGERARHSMLQVQHGVGPISGQPEAADGCDIVSGAWPDNCVDLILTSIPFGNQYEYSPSYQDLGHNSDNAAFFEQMGFLTPNLLRVLKPGRIAAIHVKDRVRFGNVTGDGFPTVEPFSDHTAKAFLDAGFRLIARITIDTDVVRENNQTYRLGWSENAKDSSKMGAGMPEYVLVFRKLPSDTSDGYADTPVQKSKDAYTRADWQIDAAGLWRDSGDRLPDPELLKHVPLPELGRLWERHCLAGGYQFEEHLALAKALEKLGKLPSSFMLFPPVSRNKDVWTDIIRMDTLNKEQSSRQLEMHVCPLQLGIIKRLITRYTNAGEIVFDPFAGIFSVPQMAVRMGRVGWGTELSLDYWKDGVHYCECAEAEIAVPTLFDLAELDRVA